jgi:hypothetical protein
MEKVEIEKELQALRESENSTQYSVEYHTKNLFLETVKLKAFQERIAHL